MEGFTFNPPAIASCSLLCVRRHAVSTGCWARGQACTSSSGAAAGSLPVSSGLSLTWRRQGSGPAVGLTICPCGLFLSFLFLFFPLIFSFFLSLSFFLSFFGVCFDEFISSSVEFVLLSNPLYTGVNSFQFSVFISV